MKNFEKVWGLRPRRAPSWEKPAITSLKNLILQGNEIQRFGVLVSGQEAYGLEGVQRFWVMDSWLK